MMLQIHTGLQRHMNGGIGFATGRDGDRNDVDLNCRGSSLVCVCAHQPTHTHKKNQGFDMDCVKLWCGQVGEIDPLKYDKFYRDRDYVQQRSTTYRRC